MSLQAGEAHDRNRRRTRLVILHSGLGLLARLGGIAAMFAAMPLMLRMLGDKRMGAWLVLLSILQWIAFFDLGIGAGARNEIARAIAKGQVAEARAAIATGAFYTVVTTAVVLLLCASALAVRPAMDWVIVHTLGNVEARSAVWIVLVVSCTSFALSFVNNVFAAMEKAAAASVLSLLSNALFLLLLLCISGTEVGLLEISLLYAAALIAANVALLGYFSRKFPQYFPSRLEVDHGLRSKIFHFGLRIFLIQLSALVIFTSHRLIVSMLISPSAVIAYDAAFKIFGLVMMTHSLVMGTMWSSFTQAYHQQDWAWLRASIKRLIQLMVPLVVSCVALAWLCPFLIAEWLGQAQVGDAKLYFWFAVVTALSCWSNIFAYFLNGVGKTNVQMWTAVAAAAIIIPCSVFFISVLHQGIAGVLMATALSLSLFSIAGPLQTKYLLDDRREKSTS